MNSAKFWIKFTSRSIDRHRNLWIREFAGKKSGDAGDNWSPKCSFEARNCPHHKWEWASLCLCHSSLTQRPPQPHLLLSQFSAPPCRPRAAWHQQEERRSDQEGPSCPRRVLSWGIFPRSWNGFWRTGFSSGVPDTLSVHWLEFWESWNLTQNYWGRGIVHANV